MLKILQARLQQYVKCELPDVQAGFRKGRGIRNQIAKICCFIEKAREFQKNICFIDYAKAFDCVDHNKLWEILKDMGIIGHFTCLLRNLYAGQEAAVRTGHGTIDWFKIGKGKTNKQIGKGICQGCILSPCFFITYVQSISCEMPGWMNHKLKSRFLGKIPTNSDNRYHSKGRKRRGTKESLGEGERGE